MKSLWIGGTCRYAFDAATTNPERHVSETSKDRGGQHGGIEQNETPRDPAFDLRGRCSLVSLVNFSFAGERRDGQIRFKLRQHGELGPIEFAVRGEERRPGRADDRARGRYRPQPNRFL